MTKHIVGLIIFTLIVGTSAIIAGLLGYVSTPETTSVRTYNDSYKYYKKKRKKRCRKHRKPRPKEFSVQLTHANLDKATGNFTTNFYFIEDFYGETDVDLHFFVKDSFGIQYLKKETISVSPNQSIYENTFSWLDRLESKDNIYVIAKVNNSYRNDDYTPSFDAEEATPVLIKAAE